MDSIVKDVPKDFSVMPLLSNDQVILQVANHVNATLLVQILMIKHSYQFVTGWLVIAAVNIMLLVEIAIDAKTAILISQVLTYEIMTLIYDWIICSQINENFQCIK